MPSPIKCVVGLVHTSELLVHGGVSGKAALAGSSVHVQHQTHTLRCVSWCDARNLDSSPFCCFLCACLVVFFQDLGVGTEEVVALALLLGSDYTEGVRGVGIVNAMEVREENARRLIFHEHTTTVFLRVGCC